MVLFSDIDLRYILRPHFNLMTLFGYFQVETFDKYQTIYQIYMIFMIVFTLIIYSTTEIVNFFLSFDDVTKLSDATFLFLTHMCQMIKLCYFYLYKYKVYYLFNNLNKDSFKPNNWRQLKMLETSMTNTRIVYMIFVSLCVLTCFLWAIFPLIEEGEMRLALASWYPFDTNTSPIFEIVYIYQIFSVTIGGTMNVTLDSVATGFMAHICAQFDILNDQLRHIREQSIENLIENKKSLKSVNKDGDYEYKMALENEMDKQLRRCIMHHYDLLEYGFFLTLQYH